MKVLIIGSGGREHALCESLSESKVVTEVIVSPGNPGMKETLHELKIEPVLENTKEEFLKVALKHSVALTIVGPEVYLSEGIVDLFQSAGLLIVGPSKSASLLESSKSFAKKIMKSAEVSTAQYEEFFDLESALKYIEEGPMKRMVVKCDGLAQGKGVIVCQSKNEGRVAVISLMKEAFLGENVGHVIVEEFLEGIEVSMFALCDGEDFTILGSACDYKRLLDDDIGPNTGGMGVFSPASVLTEEDRVWMKENVFTPILKEMKKEGTPFSGILFAGLMKTYSGWKVLEFNVRLGDPETQALLPLMDEDLFPWLMASAVGGIKKLQLQKGSHSPKQKQMRSVHVVMAAHGYPGALGEKVRSGDEIKFSETFNLSPYDYLYFAGVDKKGAKLLTKGGRIIGVTSLAETYTLARVKVYEHVSQIHFDGCQYRSDIAKGQF